MIGQFLLRCVGFPQVTISEIVRRRNNTFSKVKNIVATAKTDEDETGNGE